ncbi:hypothetical protein LTR17_005760 [Elasticomyces elasticus]|nr:hypothetical protein LTR17_005760 [Elasticomyces elasticus]
MILFAVLALLGLLLPASLAHPLPISVSNLNNSLVPRWYSVPSVTTGVGAWPVTNVDNVKGNTQPVRYCFADPNSADLQYILDGAWAKWSTAAGQSALQFILDPGCNGDETCLCSSLTQPSDALYVYDMSDDESFTHDAATIGYEPQSNVAGRHTLRIAAWEDDDDDDVYAKQLSVAHELGHAFGLAHEFQRPTRDSEVRFVCQNLDYYQFAINEVAEALALQPAFPDLIPECMIGDVAMEPKDCVDNVVCKNLESATKFFEEAVEYIIGSDVDGFNSFEASQSYDYESLMTYSSFGNAVKPTGKFPEDAVLVGTRDGREIQIEQGGDSEPEHAGPSAGDVDRIKMLYPKNIAT